MFLQAAVRRLDKRTCEVPLTFVVGYEAYYTASSVVIGAYLKIINLFSVVCT